MRTRLFLALVLAAFGCSGTSEGPSGSLDGAGDDGGPGSDDVAHVDGDGTDGRDSTDGTDGVQPCQTPYEHFETRLWPELLGVKCLVCHNQAGIAKDSNMVFLKPEQPDFLSAK